MRQSRRAERAHGLWSLADSKYQATPAAQVGAGAHHAGMRSTHLITAALAGCLAAGFALADAAPVDKAAFKAAEKRIEVQEKTERQGCRKLKDNARDVCEVEAKGR